MKYKKEYLKLKEQLAAETKEKERYESYWHTEKDITTYQEEKISKLEKDIKNLKTSKLELEVSLLRKIVSLYEREPQKTIIESGISGQFATPNGATTSSTTTMI